MDTQIKEYQDMKRVIRCYLLMDFERKYGHLKEKVNDEIYKTFKEEYAMKEIEQYIDPLTGVYTRKIVDLLKEYDGNIHYGLCVFIDLNNLKTVNDKYGHTEGDIYLKIVTDLIKESLLSGDILLRKGGDEFIIMSTRSNGDTLDTIRYYNKILNDVNETLNEINETVKREDPHFYHKIYKKSGPLYQISFGISRISINKPAAEAIIEAFRIADEKMYKHKKTFKKPLQKENIWREYVIMQ